MAATGNSSATTAQLDVVFDGTWVMVPSLDAAGNIVAVDVYSPDCGHPHGAVFVNQIAPNPWPQPSSFYMLDDHRHALDITRNSGSQTGMQVGGVNQTVNHCVAPGRSINSTWDLMISINAGPDAWVSGDTIVPQYTDPQGTLFPCFSGQDVPAGSVSTLQTLTFLDVSAISFCGAPSTFQALLPSPWTGVGSLIIEGEIPYIPTMQHERGAIAALAELAGLDLRLDYPLPSSRSVQPIPQGIQPRSHTGPICTSSVLILPQ